MAEPLQLTTFTNLNGTAQNLSNGEMTVSKLAFVNGSSADAWVGLYDAAAANVTFGTTTPMFEVVVPATASGGPTWAELAPYLWLTINATFPTWASFQTEPGQGYATVVLNHPLRFVTRLSATSATASLGNSGSANGVNAQVWTE